MNWLSLVIRGRPPAAMLCRLAPGVRRSVEGPGFFFTLYHNKTHGPHLRLRLLVSAAERAVLVRALGPGGRTGAAPPRRLRIWLRRLVALQRSGAQVLPSRYMREYRRYGGRGGVARAEDFFAATSRLCLDQVYGPGAQTMTTLKLQCFRATLRCFLRTLGPAFRGYLRSSCRTARLADGSALVLAARERRRIRVLLEDPRYVDAATRAGVRRWSHALRLYLALAGGTTTPADQPDFWHSLLHMTANKLGIDPVLERVLLDALV